MDMFLQMSEGQGPSLNKHLASYMRRCDKLENNRIVDNKTHTAKLKKFPLRRKYEIFWTTIWVACGYTMKH